MFSKFSDDSQKILIRAKKEMMEFHHPYVGSEHLLLAILKYKNDVSAKLKEEGITYDIFKKEVLRVVGLGEEDNHWFLFTPLLNRIIETSVITSRELNFNEVEVSHLFLALLEEGDGVAIRILSTLDVDIDGLYEEFSTKSVDKKSRHKKKLLIEEFGVDLTEKALNAEIDPVIGRDDEIEKLINILSRRCKNNPLLVGEAGGGKTAVVEELARRISKEEVPEHLKGKRIISVEIASLVAGTKYRGEFEERVSKILKEIESRDDVIIFIDEVHTIVGAGGAEGAIDASNILKPSLARGKFKLIGATTLEEYKKTIEKDKAFDRRFQKIEIMEPNEEKTYQILLELKDLFCSFHRVSIEDDLLKEIISLTNKYMHNRMQPDKSIDILDEVCSKVQLQNSKEQNEIRLIKRKLDKLQIEKNNFVVKQDFKNALILREKEKELLDKKNNLLFKNFKNTKIKKVTLSDIEEVIFEKTRIPIFNMETSNLKNLELSLEKLYEKVLGHEDNIKKLCSFTKRLKMGFCSLNRPASFLFVGPTGVGKTYLAKEYAKLVGGENAFIRLDMSEFREGHTISKIIGSPSGYVGYDDGKNILEDVRNNPFSVILLDEIEKASPEVLNLFLQILDEGYIKDSTGKKICFQHATIIMTSNIGFGKEEIGFCKDSSSVNSKLKEFLSVEFLNRIDEVMIFEQLTDEVIRKILDKKIKEVKDKFLEKGITLKIGKKVIEEIIELSNYREYGARKLDKILESKVDSIVIDEILDGKNNVVINTINV